MDTFKGQDNKFLKEFFAKTLLEGCDCLAQLYKQVEAA